MRNPIYVGICIAYDWHLLEHAIPAVYDGADIICLAIDDQRRSWANKPFNWNEQEFQDFVRRIDPKKKIQIIEGDFHQSGVAMENEVRQRNFIAKHLAGKGWHVQLDCDEYFVDFKGFVNYLQKLRPQAKTFNVCCPLVTLIKKVEGGYLYVFPKKKKDLEYFPIATETPIYDYGRRNGHFNLYTPFHIIHQSWARERTEIIQKLNNWGHITDFDTAAFAKSWDDLNATNYKEVSNFHPIKPPLWPQLQFGAGNSIDEFIDQLNLEGMVHMSSLDLALRNSRLVAKLRSLF